MFSIFGSIAAALIPSIIKKFGAKAVAGVAASPGKSKIIVTAALVALLVGLFGGYYITSTFYDAAHAKTLELALVQRDELIDKLKADHKAQIQIDREVAAGHIERLTVISESKPKTIEVTKYVKVNDPIICNVPVGSVGMLDNMRTGDRAGLQSVTGISDDSAGEPSAITRSTEYKAHGQAAIAFRECQSTIKSIREHDLKQQALYPKN
mgnify:CR=1 FL=1|tara:strand:- start:18048 stop:18674 length:627 start_codon:yes stop_codon:yes gene_type:complete